MSSSDHIITRTQTQRPSRQDHAQSDRADEPIVAVLISLGLTGQNDHFVSQTPISIHFCLVNETFPNPDNHS